MSDVSTAPQAEVKPDAAVGERLKKALFSPKEDSQIPVDAPASTDAAEEADAPEGEEGTPNPEQAEQDELKSSEATEPSFTAVIGGKSEELPVSKLIALAQQGADYTQKTQTLASEKKAVDTAKVEVGNLQKTYIERLGMLEAALKPQLPTPEAMNAALQKGDTATYLQMQNQVMQFNTVMGERQRASAEQAQLSQAQLQQRLAEEQRLLHEKAPEFKDEATHTRLATYLVEQGLPEEDVNSINSHVLLIMGEKSRKWDELQAKSATTQKKIEAAPKLTKPTARQGESAVTDERFKQAKQSFLQAGTVRDLSSADRVALAKRLGIN